MMNKRNVKRTIGCMLFAIGVGLVIWQTNWIVGVGLFVAVWGNNVEIGIRAKEYTEKVVGAAYRLLSESSNDKV